MDDIKLLTVTNYKLTKKKEKEKKEKKEIKEKERINLTLFGGIEQILTNSLIEINEPLLPSKGIPKHLFDKKKPKLINSSLYSTSLNNNSSSSTIKTTKGRKLKPNKEIQKILENYQNKQIQENKEIKDNDVSYKFSQSMSSLPYSLHHNQNNNQINNNNNQNQINNHNILSHQDLLSIPLRSKSQESERHLKHEISTLPNERIENLPIKLKSLDEAFHGVHKTRFHDMYYERQKAIDDVENYIHHMPLKYLYSKPTLRHYAIKKSCERFYKLCEIKRKQYLIIGFHKWKHIPQKALSLAKLNEKQIGFIVLSKRLDVLIKRQLKRFFYIWAFSFAAKFDSIRTKQYNDAAYLIQDWFRNVKLLKKQPFHDLNAIIRMCLYRRRAIFYAIKFEQTRRKGLNKIRKGIATRRRYHYAARTIQRIVRWIFLYRHTTYKLTRQINARKIQRAYRKMLHRPLKDLLLIQLGFRLGSYSRVKSRIPIRYLIDKKLLESINMCISTIQRWYLSCLGRLELFMKFAARRSAMEYEAKINQNAKIIQNFYRHHLWKELLRAAFINNRARRIQRAYRSYQYRYCMYRTILRRRNRIKKKIYLFIRHKFWLRKLKKRFNYKKIQLQLTQINRRIMAKKIQKAYREHVIYVAIKKEQMRIFFAAQRLKADVVLASVRRIQLNFRNSRRPVSKLCRHVRLFALREKNKERYVFWGMAFRIQKLARQHIIKQRKRDLQIQVDAANKIWRLAKSYLLRRHLHYLIEATRKKRNAAAKLIQYNYRQFTWLKKLQKRFYIMKQRIELERLRNRSAKTIQLMIRRKYYEYNTPVRIASRRQLKKQRKIYRKQRLDKLFNYSARIIQKLFHMNARWMRFCRLVHVIRIQILQNNAAKKIQRLIRAFLSTARVNRCVRERIRRNQQELERQRKQRAANTIGRFWRRSKELFMLHSLFKLRRVVLDEQARLQEERRIAEAARDDALEEVKITEENMQATINSSWQQGSDTTGRNYYYNYVTGESMWEPPPGWTLKIVDQWIRNINERGQVYYYNQLSGESKWLPPCCQCGKDAERWCTDCCLSYCVEDYQALHNPEVDPGMAEHTWAVAELEKEILKPGQVYCIECKKRVCTRVCLVCWDFYCDPCFRYVHHVGDLKLHETISYARAKKGWIAIKPKEKGEKIYYLNGVTGETTYEKPVELMNEAERINYENFVSHRQAAEKHVKTIEKLQLELEGLKYERDLRLAKETPDLLAQQNQKKSNETGEVLANMTKGKGGPFSFLGGLNQKYVEKLMKPDNRRRGEKRSDYIQSLLDNKDMT